MGGDVVVPAVRATHKESAIEQPATVGLRQPDKKHDLFAGPRHDCISLLDFFRRWLLAFHFKVNARVRQPEVREVVTLVDADKIRLVQVKDSGRFQQAGPHKLGVGAKPVAVMVIDRSALSHQKFTFTTLSWRAWFASGRKRDLAPWKAVGTMPISPSRFLRMRISPMPLS